MDSAPARASCNRGAVAGRSVSVNLLTEFARAGVVGTSNIKDLRSSPARLDKTELYCCNCKVKFKCSRSTMADIFVLDCLLIKSFL